MSTELQPILIDCGEVNPGGVQTLEIVPFEWVKTYPHLIQSTNRLFFEIVLEPLKEWLAMPFRPESLKEESILNPNSHYGIYNNLIEFEIPSEKDTLSAALEHYRRHRFIVKIKDKSGITKIFGSKNNPCELKFSYTSGKKVADFKGYKLQFQQLSSSKPPTYPF